MFWDVRGWNLPVLGCQGSGISPFRGVRGWDVPVSGQGAAADPSPAGRRSRWRSPCAPTWATTLRPATTCRCRAWPSASSPRTSCTSRRWERAGGGRGAALGGAGGGFKVFFSPPGAEVQQRLVDRAAGEGGLRGGLHPQPRQAGEHAAAAGAEDEAEPPELEVGITPTTPPAALLGPLPKSIPPSPLSLSLSPRFSHAANRATTPAPAWAMW